MGSCQTGVRAHLARAVPHCPPGHDRTAWWWDWGSAPEQPPPGRLSPQDPREGWSTRRRRRLRGRALPLGEQPLYPHLPPCLTARPGSHTFSPHRPGGRRQSLSTEDTTQLVHTPHPCQPLSMEDRHSVGPGLKAGSHSRRPHPPKQGRDFSSLRSPQGPTSLPGPDHSPCAPPPGT